MTPTHDDKHFDVIIVGAGPSGLAAATVCARAGLNTIVIERGDKPGTKNVMGGIMYTRPTAEVWPEFWKEAPVERPIVEQQAWILTPDSALKMGLRTEKLLGDIPNCYSVLRVKMDRWFATQAEKAGALILCETRVDELLKDGDKVVGVRCGREDGELFAPVVILSEGVNPQLAIGAGMQKRLKPNQAASAVKEVISLPEEVINNRFNLPDSSQGVAMELMADACAGMVGMAWIYTNKTTLSIGVGTLLADALESQLTPFDLLVRLKQHPMVAPLLEGGETLEYMSHMIPEGGFNAMPQLFGNGVMITGDAAMLVNAMHREGSNHAMSSGRLAAETAIEAHAKGDFTTRVLNHYRERLEHSPTLPDLRKYRIATHFVETHPIFKIYPQLAADAAYEMMSVDGGSKRSKQWKILRMLFERRNILGLAWDGLDGARSTL
jgi:electron transfer flavoprotein-quinone oxidoreductase